jgi:hypothetical protein
MVLDSPYTATGRGEMRSEGEVRLYVTQHVCCWGSCRPQLPMLCCAELDCYCIGKVATCELVFWLAPEMMDHYELPEASSHVAAFSSVPLDVELVMCLVSRLCHAASRADVVLVPTTS